MIDYDFHFLRYCLRGNLVIGVLTTSLFASILVSVFTLNRYKQFLGCLFDTQVMVSPIILIFFVVLLLVSITIYFESSVGCYPVTLIRYKSFKTWLYPKIICISIFSAIYWFGVLGIATAMFLIISGTSISISEFLGLFFRYTYISIIVICLYVLLNLYISGKLVFLFLFFSSIVSIQFRINFSIMTFFLYKVTDIKIALLWGMLPVLLMALLHWKKQAPFTLQKIGE